MFVATERSDARRATVRVFRAAFIFLLLATSIFVLATSDGFRTEQVQGMGQAPSTCPNHYAGGITQFIVGLPNGTSLDLFSHPNATIRVPIGEAYSVSFVIHTANASSEGNTQNGTTWYSTSAPGFGEGVCVYQSSGVDSTSGLTPPTCNGVSGGVCPDEDVHVVVSNLTLPAVLNPNPANEDVQSVYWMSYTGAMIEYTVEWTADDVGQSSTSSSTTLSVTTQPTSSNSFTTVSMNTVTSAHRSTNTTMGSSTIVILGIGPGSAFQALSTELALLVNWLHILLQSLF